MPDTDVLKALQRVAPFAVGLIVMVVVARIRGLSLRKDACLVLPSWKLGAAWLVFWIAWVAFFEWLSRLSGYPPEAPKAYSPAVIAIQVFGMVVLAPAMEELLFRGLLFRLFERTRLGANGAVLVTAALFTAMHVQYWDQWLPLLQTFLDGILFGLARKTARSVPLCFLMHALGNGYAAYLKFHG